MKYLIKFVGKKEYAQDIKNGVLFANSLYYYSSSTCPKKFRDESEAAFTFLANIKTSDVYRYAISFYETDSSIVNFNDIQYKQIIKRLKPKFAVIIEKDKFLKRLVSIGDSILEYNNINYCSEATINHKKLCFNKHYSFAYQNEFRVVFKDKYKTRTFKRNAYGLHGNQLHKYNPAKDGKKYFIQSLTDIATIVDVGYLSNNKTD